MPWEFEIIAAVCSVGWLEVPASWVPDEPESSPSLFESMLVCSPKLAILGRTAWILLVMAELRFDVLGEKALGSSRANPTRKTSRLNLSKFLKPSREMEKFPSLLMNVGSQPLVEIPLLWTYKGHLIVRIVTFSTLVLAREAWLRQVVLIDST